MKFLRWKMHGMSLLLPLMMMGVEHQGVAAEINQSLAHAGIEPKRVKFFVCDEGSVIIAAYKHVLKPLFPDAHLLV